MSESDIPDFRGGVKEKWREGDIAECIAVGVRSYDGTNIAIALGQRLIVEHVHNGLGISSKTGRKYYVIALRFEEHPEACLWQADCFRKVGLEDTEEHIRRAAARHGLRTALDRVADREKVEAV